VCPRVWELDVKGKTGEEGHGNTERGVTKSRSSKTGVLRKGGVSKRTFRGKRLTHQLGRNSDTHAEGKKR